LRSAALDVTAVLPDSSQFHLHLTKETKRNPRNLQLNPACTILYQRLIQASGFAAAVIAAGNKSPVFSVCLFLLRQ
jgi:hypothetical protein